MDDSQAMNLSMDFDWMSNHVRLQKYLGLQHTCDQPYSILRTLAISQAVYDEKYCKIINKARKNE